MVRKSTIVIKLGTSSIVHETTHQPLLSTLSSVVETVIRLKNDGHKVVLVSSGAIGVGMKRMELDTRPTNLSQKQALAAIGQGRLIALWDNLFGQLGQPIAQILLTRSDISDRTRYLNAVNTLSELLRMGVVPIVNENDTVSVSEIKFGDNDTLSAITSCMLHADYLFLLTDVDGLYTSNPRKDTTAKAIAVVESVQDIRSQVSTATLGSNLGTGGMETKLIAAEIATSAGVATAICSSKHPESMVEIIEYSEAVGVRGSREIDDEEGATTPREPTIPLPSDTPTTNTPSSSLSVPLTSGTSTPSSSSLPPIRPPHTMFLPSPSPVSDLKSWTSHMLTPAGSVIVDAGAHLVLSRRDSGGRLLPAGVVGVQGVFASGQAVRVVVRRRKNVVEAEAEAAGTAEANGYVNVPSANSLLLHESTNSFGNGSPTVMTQPGTPRLLPVASMTSSISTLETLPSVETSPVETRHASGFHHTGKGTSADDEWELVEVGRGLAVYNSVQIESVKGLKSTNISQLLGYADSEYVVENITIRIPP